MAEAHQQLEPHLAAAPAPRPGTLGGRVPPLFNLALFALTGASVLFAGLDLNDSADGTSPWPRAIGFTAALLAILLSHEMGHFLLARKHGVDATWPFFIPAPLVSLIGTFGAVIRLRQLPRSRRALIDIAAAGPLIGFAVTLPVLALGLHLSRLVPTAAEPAAFTLFDGLVALVRTGHFPALRDGIGLGEPLAMQILERLVLGPLPAGQSLDLHPVAIAGWFGLFLTALNLLPIGQLDGGHLLFASSRRLHAALGAPAAAALVGLGIFTPFTGWAFWGLLMGLFLVHHPPLAEPEERLSAGRRAVVFLCMATFVFSFCPAPVSMLLR
jgi:membrane-associated protease RseP (regulator of RpoE activity)